MAGVALFAAPVDMVFLRCTVLRRRQEAQLTRIHFAPDLQPTPVSPSTRDLGARFFVWGLWFLTLVGAFSFVARYGSNFPVCDDWAFVQYATGEEQITAESLWHQHNEHRIPLPKVVSLALSKLSRCDYPVVSRIYCTNVSPIGKKA